MDTIKKNCPTWDYAEKAVQPNVLTNKIVADKFNQADDKTRKVVLNAAFGMAFEKVAGNVNHNFTCFNADHEDRTPSMVFDKAKYAKSNIKRCLHTAVSNGRWCGVERPECGAPAAG